MSDSRFRKELLARQSDPGGRRWLFIPYDQLNAGVGPLAREAPEELGIVLAENPWKARRRPYHRQKLALVLSNLRHFALEQAERGVAVRHLVGDGPYARILEPVVEELGPLRLMRPAERELRVDLAPLVAKQRLQVIPHEGWLTAREHFDASFPRGKPWRMDSFYRHVRRETGILMEGGKPKGGRFSFDTENRKPWRGEPPAPDPPRFEVHPITEEVVGLVESRFQKHPGRLRPEALPARAEDAEKLWRWARRHCLEHFGPYEDAMSLGSRTLFHTLISSLLNNLRLLPSRVVRDVARMELPIASQEGFIRQVLGWREFMRHVHEATDGFRELPGGSVPGRRVLDEGASPSALGSKGRLPPAWWGEPSGLQCLDTVVSEVWDTGYGHHITRLMVLSNLATLIGVSPRQLCDWFWVAYTDAYDWVVEPNVLGMGSFGLGTLFTTKPYVSGAAYIDRMSDYCGACAFSPKRDCPITSLYWSFLDRKKKTLDGNPRMGMPLRALAKRSAEQRKRDARIHRWVRRTLEAGGRLRPEDRPDPGA